MKIKTKELGKTHLEHLFNIGFKTDWTQEELIDSPYILLENDKISVCYSVGVFNSFAGEIKTKEQILKLRPLNEKEQVKQLSNKEKALHKLLTLLNTKKNSNITGYDVSWTLQESNRFGEKGRYEILPISPNACGSISMEHLEIALNFAKERNLDLTLTYTDWNEHKKRYGTSRPCFYFY